MKSTNRIVALAASAVMAGFLLALVIAPGPAAADTVSSLERYTINFTADDGSTH